MQEISIILSVSFHSILPLFIHLLCLLSFAFTLIIYLFRHSTYCNTKNMNTKLLIQVYLQIIPIHLALTVKLQLPCHFYNPQYCLHPPRYDER